MSEVLKKMVEALQEARNVASWDPQCDDEATDHYRAVKRIGHYAAKALAAYEASADLVPRWQPIETAPKDTKVQVHLPYYPDEPEVAMFRDAHGDGYAWYRKDGTLIVPTHWQPIPEPPA